MYATADRSGRSFASPHPRTPLLGPCSLNLIAERPQALITLGKRWLGTEVDEPTMLLWGCPIPPTARGAAIRERLIQISDLIGESPTRRTEPDVVFDFAQNGLVFIEVKLSSKNEKLIDTGKMHRYLSNTNAFSSPRAIKQSGLYQLTRNWRFGWDLAGERPFRLVNLAPLALFTESGALGSFEHGLCRHTQASFIREAWEDMLSELGAGLGGLPPWLSAWLNARQLMPPGGRRAEEGPAQ
jgi:hypothetical protein